MENSLNHAVSADYADPIKQLLTIGPPSGFDPADWPDYAMAFGLGREHIAALIHVACDAALHCGDTDRDEAWVRIPTKAATYSNLIAATIPI